MVELRDLVSFFLKPQRLNALLVAALLGSIMAGAIAAAAPKTFAVSASVAREAATAFPEGITLDGYYLIETNRAYTERLGVLLRSKAVHDEFAQKTGSSIVRTERETPLSWSMRFTAPHESQRVSDILAAILSARIAMQAEAAGEYVRLAVSVSELQPFVSPLTPFRAAFAGAVSFVLLVAFLQLLLRYFRSDSA